MSEPNVSSRMARPRPILAAVIAVGACAIWAAPSGHVHYLVLREVLRFGEWTGITPLRPAPGARLAGQIMGFNYHQPPAWYGFVGSVIAAAAALSPVLLPALWVRTRLAAGRSVPSSARAPWTRAMLALGVAAALAAILDRTLADRIWFLFFDLGKALGGRVSYLGGIVVGSGGPFTGGTSADTIGNALVNHGPRAVAVVLACGVAIWLHARLWRKDIRAAARPHLCAKCDYDLSGLSSGICPECGTPAKRTA